MQHRFILIFLVLVLVPFTSAEGLFINVSETNINKTLGDDTTFNFTIKNTDVYPYYNISFENNDYLDMDKISKLEAGETMTIESDVITENDFSGDLKIRGFYEAFLGSSNETQDINIDFNNGLDVCDMTIVEGDSIRWINNVAGDVVLVSEGEESTTIGEGEEFLLTFNNAQSFSYYFKRVIQFTEICTITVLAADGLVNDPNLDGVLNVNIDVKFPDTSIEPTFLETSYDIEAFSVQEGVIILENTGGKIAKDIIIEADWFTFTPSTLDVEIDQSRSITYRIVPVITATNQTNKTHNITLIIKGNFPTITQHFEIFVKYAEVNADSLTSGKSLIDRLREICEENPEDVLCGGGTKVIFKNSNDSQINISSTQEQWRDYLRETFNFFDAQETTNNFLKERTDGYDEDFVSLKEEIAAMTASLETLVERDDDRQNGFVSILTVVITLIIGGLLFIVIKEYKNKHTMEEVLYNANKE